MAEVAAESESAPAPAPEIDSYDPDNDIMINITLYKTGEGKTYKIYIKGDIKVTKPGNAEKNITVDGDKKLVFDSTQANNTDMIKAITELINGAPDKEGGYSSRSVSFRPSKKRRTAKKRRGRK